MTTSLTHSAPPLSSQASADLYRRIHWRLLPLLMICYLVACLDRINIGYAQLQMKTTLPFGDAVYGLGAGIFFIGYFLCEVPSNLLLEKIGLRKTLLRIMTCWGLVAAGMMFVSTPTEFYVMRFLLGVFEAGFFPGVVLYFTYWYPSSQRGKAMAIFGAAAVASTVLAGPLCGSILKYFNGTYGYAGWQWLFVLQGLPAVFLGVIAYYYLDDKPSQAEKHWLGEQVARDQSAISSGRHSGNRDLMRDPKVYLLALVNFLKIGATYAMVFWLPSLIKSWGVHDMVLIGWYAAIPNLCGMFGMVLICRHSDRQRERRWHFVGSIGIAAIGLLITIWSIGNLTMSLVGMSIASVGVAATTPLFITIVTEYLSKNSSAVGIGLITSLGMLGAAASPVATGMITARSGSVAPALYLVITLYLLAGLLLAWTIRPARAQGTL